MQAIAMSKPSPSYRAVFISDVHLGSAACKAEAVQAFLLWVDCEQLYLVGDIVDIWVSRKKGKWRQAHTNILRTILDLSENGCRVYVTPGNHDSELRRMNGIDYGNIFIDHQFVHETLDGKRLLVVHGDFFDRSVTTFKGLAILGSWMHEGMTQINHVTNGIRAKLGKKPSDFSSKAKARVKSFIKYFTNFEDRITVDAKNQGYDGVVCGHIHKPAFELHEESGAYYVNSGDWMQNCSAFVEHHDGRLELIYWADIAEQMQPQIQELKPAKTSSKR
jgi:UDP-2,3-diacylglucosamine pyrophosphatase LpxH